MNQHEIEVESPNEAVVIKAEYPCYAIGRNGQDLLLMGGSQKGRPKKIIVPLFDPRPLEDLPTILKMMVGVFVEREKKDPEDLIVVKDHQTLLGCAVCSGFKERE